MSFLGDNFDPDSLSRKPGVPGRIGSAVAIAAPAKINLFLRVMRKRPDGYHDIYSWFQMVNLFDFLRIEPADDGQILIETNSPNLPTGPENLVYRAAQVIQNRVGRPIGFNIRLQKEIPLAAGLGGGSSDAAAFILAADTLYDLKMSRTEMAEMGLELGSDIPFFFGRGQSEVSGRGEIVKPIELSIDYTVVLVTPPFHIRAAEAYSKLNLSLTEPVQNVNFNSCQQAKELFAVVSNLDNDLERALRTSYPILDKIGKRMRKQGADIVRLTGSGPTMFALFKTIDSTREDLKHAFEGEGWGVWIVRPIVLPA